MPIVTVAQLSDNYAYLVIDDGSKQCAVVDCAEADKVIAAAKSHGAKIVAVMTTHWHGDHSGGNNDIASKVPGIKVYGASAEGGKIPALTNPVADGIPVRLLPPELIGPSKTSWQTIPLNSLQQPPTDVYRLATGDVLGVFIDGYLGASTQPLPSTTLSRPSE